MFPKTWEGGEGGDVHSQDLRIVTLSLTSLGVCLSGARASGFCSVRGSAPARAPHPGRAVQPLRRITSKSSLFASCGASCFLNK